MAVRSPSSRCPMSGHGHLALGLAVLIGIGLVFQQVDVALYLPIHHIGHHQRAHHRAQTWFSVPQIPCKSPRSRCPSSLTKKMLGDALFGSRFKAFLRPDGHAAFARNHQHRAAGRRGCPRPHASSKVEQAGSVQQVDLGILPLHRAVERMETEALRLISSGSKSQTGVPVGDPAQSVGRPGLETKAASASEVFPVPAWPD